MPGVSKSSISGELTRNYGKKDQRPKQAQSKADKRKKSFKSPEDGASSDSSD
ncbi:MAG: hypothetical protein PHO08_00040 [Methylococcales bacterium]|nr:hypothetical protein [Methylococcales bacterium]